MAAYRLAAAGIQRMPLCVGTGAVAMGCSVGRAQDNGAKPHDAEELAKKRQIPWRL